MLQVAGVYEVLPPCIWFQQHCYIVSSKCFIRISYERVSQVISIFQKIIGDYQLALALKQIADTATSTKRI